METDIPRRRTTVLMEMKMKFGFLFVASTWVGVPICAALGLSVQGAVMYASGVTVGILVSRFAARQGGEA